MLRVMPAGAKPPNIVVIMSDDQGAWSIGNPDIDAPNLSRLVRDGMLFTNFFCASPVCSPARATMLTGRMPSQHGVHDWIRDGNVAGDSGGADDCSKAAKSTSVPIQYLSNELCYTDVLSDAGYECGLSGKWHLGDSVTPQHGFTFWRTHARGAGDYYNPPMVSGNVVERQEGYVTDIITDNALEFLAKRRIDRPFYLGVHYTAPHSPWERAHHPAELFDRYFDNCAFENFPDEPMHPWQSSTYCPRGDPEKRREFLSGYCAAITAMDNGIGRIVDALDSMSLAEDTLVFFISDNGMNMGHHGIYGKGNGTFPLNMFDTSVKVPAIAYRPGGVPAGTTYDGLLSQYDFFPTVLDYLNVAPVSESGVSVSRPRSASPGRSFAGLLRGDTDPGHELVVSGSVLDEYGPVRMIRTSEWKLVKRAPYGPHELFHLTEDPVERVNLYGDPTYGALSRDLEGELHNWFTRHSEPRADGLSFPVTGLGQVARIGPRSEAFVAGGAERVAEVTISVLAQQGNETLRGTIAGALLSDLGKRLHLPNGLVVQAAEARDRAHRYNATTGMATQDGEPLILSSVAEDLPGLTPTEAVSYAPPSGLPELRQLWLAQLLEKNPSLDGARMSVPIVVPGLTHGISTAADLFVSPGDTVIIPQLYWENYRLIFCVRRGARFLTYPLTDTSGCLNVTGMDELVGVQPPNSKTVLLLNFPNNPTGFSPSKRDVDRLVAMIDSHLRGGRRLLVIVDDAYFGLFHDPELYNQSLAALLSGLSERLLVIKVDGPTKEDLAWGLRVGFITFCSAGLARKHFAVLEDKAIGGIRSLVSNASRLSQTLLIRALKSSRYHEDKRVAFDMLARRYRCVKQILADRNGEGVYALPFNSGYFVTLVTGGVAAEELRQHLLSVHSIGTIAVGPHHLRIAYSSVEEEALPDLFDRIFGSIVVLQRG